MRQHGVDLVGGKRAEDRLANGRPIDFDTAWPKCVGEPVDAREHAHLCSLQAWGEQNAPHSPEANPNKPVNWLTAPLTI